MEIVAFSIIGLLFVIAILTYICNIKGEISALNKLWSKLLATAANYNIPVNEYDVILSSDGELAAGQIEYIMSNGKSFNFLEIKLLTNQSLVAKCAVLAHELGHYLAINKQQDFTEIGADNQGWFLCTGLMSKKDRILATTWLKCMFAVPTDNDIVRECAAAKSA